MQVTPFLFSSSSLVVYVLHQLKPLSLCYFEFILTLYRQESRYFRSALPLCIFTKSFQNEKTLLQKREISSEQWLQFLKLNLQSGFVIIAWYYLAMSFL